MKKWILLISAVLILAIAGTFALVTRDTPKPTEAVAEKQNLAFTPEELLAAVNAERAKVGVPALTIDIRVQKSAQLKADDMATKNYAAHEIPGTGKVLSPEMEYLLVSACTYSSENFVRADSVESAISWWKNSKSHFDAIKDSRYTLTGFGIAGGRVVEHFCIAK